jgi:precorrin-6A/cobalt-precorrin-6A reductase
VIAARGPFAEADERRLMVEHGIEVIVTKNSGGAATRAKLDAARGLGIPVLMTRRPPPSAAESVETVEGALRWLAAHHSARRGV